MNTESVFIIAELSANHGDSIDIAKETIKAAKRAGADAIKLQTYKASTITLNVKTDDFLIKNGSVWDGMYLYDLYNEASLPWEWHEELFKTAHEEGLICFSSPFDFTAVDLLEELNCPIYKIASFEITDIPLIEYIASKGKPMIISTGIADYADVDLAVETCKNAGNSDITLLVCTSSYPAPIEDANLALIKAFKERYNVKVGLSDHTLGITVPIAATALGAKVIEKHFILNKEIGGHDSTFSLNETEFTEMVKHVREAEKSIGHSNFELTPNKIISRKASRSLYISSDVKAGDLVTAENIRSVRPGLGLHTKHYKEVLGKKFTKDNQEGTALSFDLIE